MKRLIVPLILTVVSIVCLIIITNIIVTKNSEINYTIILGETDGLYEIGTRVISENDVVEYTIFKDISIGIVLFCSYTNVSNCKFINCSDEGILFTPYSHNNIISNCEFYDCNDGVELQQSTNNTFINCKFIGCYHAGVDGIMESNNNNQFIDSIFQDCYYGSYFSRSKNNTFINCEFINNSINVEEWM